MSTPQINPNDSAMPGIKFNHNSYGTESFKEETPGLTKREKLIFDLYVKFANIDPAFGKANANAAIQAADILIAEMNKELK